MKLLDYNLDLFLFSILMSFRLGAFFLSMPVISEFRLPILVRVILPMSMAMILAPVVPHKISPFLATDTFLFVYSITTEVLVGLIMGFSVHILFMLANVAGELAGLQIGFSIASVFDPNLGHSALLAFFMRLFLVLLFFITDLHHVFIWTLAKSYESVPTGTLFLPLAEIVPGFVKLFGSLYLMAFRFALPVIATIFLAHVMVGVISITAPQMNFYFNVALSLNVVFGLAIVAVSLGLLFQFFNQGMGSLTDFLGAHFVVSH